MAAIRGYPFPNYYVSQELAVRTYFSFPRNLIITEIRHRFTGKVFLEYISVSWDQAERWHKKAIKKLVLMDAIVDQVILYEE